MNNPKVALYWCAACGGCDEAVLDLAENILEVLEKIDIVFWPVALDFKRSHIEKLKDRELALSFINGAVRTSEQVEMCRLLREKSQILIAFGNCSHLGGIPGLANLHNREAIFDRVYREIPTEQNRDQVIPLEEIRVPQGKLTLPTFWDTVKTLNQVVDVDYYIPGCPPPVTLIMDAITGFLENKLPPRGSVLAPDIPLCDECPRKESKPDKLLVKEIRYPHEGLIDPGKCLLDQGLLCLGPVTRSGCGASCIKANMPCSGCIGPTIQVKDFGAKALSAIASILEASDDKEISQIVDKIWDPVGTFYRYNLPASFLHRRLQTKGGK
ncbi:MAG: oxidoreductase [Candidatus Aminicenantes bacterium]|nr:MAG: oxidoreductase [Candidatus Aminicenantes bacterium]